MASTPTKSHASEIWRSNIAAGTIGIVSKRGCALVANDEYVTTAVEFMEWSCILISTGCHSLIHLSWIHLVPLATTDIARLFAWLSLPKGRQPHYGNAAKSTARPSLILG